MEVIRGVLFSAVFLAVAACAAMPPTTAETASMQNAPKPSSQVAAEKAVVQYFDGSLKDPDSARYTFLAPTMGSLVNGNLRQFGWFMCGTVNAKNSYGGYTGGRVFLAYFDPYSSDHVRDGSVDSGQYSIVTNWCRGIYGQ